MIDKRITKTLSELETSLRNVESASKQVEKTVKSYDGLNSTTTEYVSELGNVTAKIKILVGTIEKDYTKKVKEFEEDRETIVNVSTSAIQELSNATDSFESSLLKVQSQLKYSLILNAISLVAIIGVLILCFSK